MCQYFNYAVNACARCAFDQEMQSQRSCPDHFASFVAKGSDSLRSCSNCTSAKRDYFHSLVNQSKALTNLLTRQNTLFCCTCTKKEFLFTRAQKQRTLCPPANIYFHCKLVFSCALGDGNNFTVFVQRVEMLQK